ncbi:TonB-dependent receptor [Sphingobium vermicomposti]|uniref:Outer membrane receptor protein involved in Fe transport n=1 Tax=Sphingobium vermicomposti TaxID=529005 RepID=A0A846M166_9SPHN|nr:TonB-dependent receptor [Sphingobium vermicomposti]NIJ15917.1 outer membrane receptor protein involved in Fe transport [Sphingobium vermicomposti]
MIMRSMMLAGAAMSVLAAGQVQAQSAPAPAPEMGAVIVVTAQKRLERAIDVPMSLTAVNTQELAQQNLVQLRDYFARIPGLNLNGRNSGVTTLAIRGLTTGAGSNPTVGVTIDDVPYGSASSAGYGDQLTADLDPSDLDRIEVLKGPQGTLYGASALGGLLKYVTTDPNTQEFSGRVQADASTVAHGEEGFALRGAVNIPLIADELALRVSGFYRNDPGYIDNVLTGERNTNDGHAEGGRVSLLWKPSPAVQVKLNALLQNTRTHDSGTVDTDFNLNPIFGEYEHSRIAGADSFRGKVRFYSGTVTADLGPATLTSLSGYTVNDYSGYTDVTYTFNRFAANPAAGISFANRFKTKRFSQEVRLASNGKQSIDWLVGGFFTSERTLGRQTFNEVTPETSEFQTLLGNYRYPYRYREFAGFGDLTFHFGEKLSLQVGGRYAQNKQRYNEQGNGPLDGDYTIPTRRISGSAFTWLVSPSFKITPDVMVYARAASGYRPGGPNSNAGGVVPQKYDPDRAINYELGLKGSFLDGGLVLEASGYWIDWTRIQLLQRDATGNTFYANGGKAVSRGFEVQTTARPVTGMTVATALTHTDAKLEEDVPNATIYGRKGDRLPFSAKWQASLAVDQVIPLSTDVQGSLGFTVAYLGGRIGEFNSRVTQPRLPLPGYTTLDLRAGLEFNGGVRVQLFAKNLTDKRGYVSGVPRDTIAKNAPYQLGLISPRTIGVSVAKTF